MKAVLCPKCQMAWEYNPTPDGPQVLAIHCTCGERFEPGEVFTLPTLEDKSMPRTPISPGVESYLVPTCNCDADPTDRSFWTSEGHSETCPAKLRLLLEAQQRKGDQPLPTPSTSPDIADLVVEDLKARKLVGVSRYGRALQAHNGRDAMRDAYEEALDLCNYLRQMIYERDGK